MIKKITAVCTGLFLSLLSVPVVWGEAPEPTESFYVNDYAEVLSDELEEKLCEDGKELYTETTAQVVLLTVDSTENQKISDFADDTSKKWGIGSEEEKNGVLIVLSVGDRDAWITVGDRLKDRLTDPRVNEILDECAVPYYANDEFAEGTLQTYYTVLNEVREEYGLETVEIPEINNEFNADEGSVLLDTVTSDDVELKKLVISLLLVIVMLVAGYVCLTSIPLFLVVNFVILLRWLFYLILDHFFSSGRSNNYAEKYYSKEAVFQRAYDCLDWPGVIIEWLGYKDDEDDEDDLERESEEQFANNAEDNPHKETQ